MPLDTAHRLDDGTTLDHRAIIIAYGMQMCEATYDGLRKLQATSGPFVLHARSPLFGAQRYAAN